MDGRLLTKNKTRREGKMSLLRRGRGTSLVSPSAQSTVHTPQTGSVLPEIAVFIIIKLNLTLNMAVEASVGYYTANEQRCGWQLRREGGRVKRDGSA